jgi:tRNA threonylcarbamoyladenosine biosynthesis protein TsaB
MPKVSRLTAESGHKTLCIKRLKYIIRFLLMSMMIPKCINPKILAFDTSSLHGSVALLEGQDVRAEIRTNSTKTHSSMLLKSVDFLLKSIGWQLKDLNLIAAGIGPGSFTGIRIGVSTALGFAQTLALPFAGISGLDALAHQNIWLEGSIGILLDAHRSQYYYAEYVSNKGRLRQTHKPTLINISDLEDSLKDRQIYVVGDMNAYQWKTIKKDSAHWPQLVPVDLFLASGIGRLALLRKNIWRSGEYVVSEPLYIRPPDAIKNRTGKH